MALRVDIHHQHHGAGDAFFQRICRIRRRIGLTTDHIHRSRRRRRCCRRSHLLRLRCPCRKRDSTAQQCHQNGTGCTTCCGWHSIAKHGNSLLERVAETEVTAQRCSLQRELGGEQGVAIAAAQLRLVCDHIGIAGQFLVVAHACNRHMQQRVAPEQTAQQRRQHIAPRITTGDVAALVRQHQRLLLRIEAGLEIRRQHDLRTPQPQCCRQTGARRLRPQHTVVRQQMTKAAPKPTLRPPLPDGSQRGTGQPQRQQQAAPVDCTVRRRVRSNGNHRQHQHVRQRRPRSLQAGGRQPCGQRRQRHQRPQRIGRVGTKRLAQRPAQQQHQHDDDAGRQRGLDQSLQQLMTGHHRSPAAVCAAPPHPCGSICAVRKNAPPAAPPDHRTGAPADFHFHPAPSPRA